MNQPTIKKLMLLVGLINQPLLKPIGINSQTAA
jgi:hypothetical protein